jgi:hypothetical protein
MTPLTGAETFEIVLKEEGIKGSKFLYFILRTRY